MKRQTLLVLLLVAALASVDLSALASMTSELAADAILALAASQVGLAGLWCGAGRGSCFVRLAVAGLLVNTWSCALGPFGHEMAVVLVSELGLVLAGALAWRLLRRDDQTETAAVGTGPGSLPRVSLADMLALTAIFALLLGPLRTLAPASAAHELKLLGAALGCQALAMGWAMLGSGSVGPRCFAALAATLVTILAADQILMSPLREWRVALLAAALLVAALAVVRLSCRTTAAIGATA
jgi:hypothetical protein